MEHEDTESYCTHCGSVYLDPYGGWPRTCSNVTTKKCGKQTWKNPKPVAIGVVRIGDGILIGRRKNKPGVGKWALPGGFVNWGGESWQQAFLRELYEETGLDFQCDEKNAAESFHHLASTSVDSGNIIHAGFFDAGPEFPQGYRFVENEESDGIQVVTVRPELAFATHTAAAKMFFDHLERDRMRYTLHHQHCLVIPERKIWLK